MNNDLAFIGIVLMLLGLLLMLMGGCHIPNMGSELPPRTFEQTLLHAVDSTNWLITVCIVGIAISLAALVNGSKLAIGPLIGCLTALILDLAVIRYANVLAFIGLGGAVGVLGWIIYVKRRAFSEVVKTVEKIKPTVAGFQDALFRNHNSVANKIQTFTTRKLVIKAKKSLTPT